MQVVGCGLRNVNLVFIEQRTIAINFTGLFLNVTGIIEIRFLNFVACGINQLEHFIVRVPPSRR